MNVRPAHVDDAKGIAYVHVRAWRTAYRDIVPADYLASLSVEKRTTSWRDHLAKASPEIWVAEELPEVVGWVAFGSSRDTDAEQDTGEVEALYVLPEYWSTGTGRALWQKARARLKERGFRRATLWVLAENSRAIGFYGAAGFAPTLNRSIEIGGKVLSEVRYEVPIG
jgi:ribosomal protein S18 acetylase RimI-like enzyme